MNTETIKVYNKMYEDFVSGKISDEEWQTFVDVILNDILEENKDVLIRLKDR